MQRLEKKKKKPKTDLKLDVVFLPYKQRVLNNNKAQPAPRMLAPTTSPSKRSRPEPTDFCDPLLDSQESFGFFSQDLNLTAPASPLSSSSVLAGTLSPSLSLSPLTQASPPVVRKPKKQRAFGCKPKKKRIFLSKKRKQKYMLDLTADVVINIQSAWDAMCTSQQPSENAMRALASAIASVEELREQLTYACSRTANL